MSSNLWSKFGDILRNTYGTDEVVRCKYCGIFLATHDEMKQIAQKASAESGIDESFYMWAGTGEATVDHVIPKSRGGTDDIENLVPCCKRCNSKKGNRDYFTVEMEYPDAGFLFDPNNELKRK